jgi:putative ABC transport system permease protein
MSDALRLAWRYLRYHRARSLLLVAALTLTVVLPLSSRLLVNAFSERLGARARATPLVLGAKGDRFNLVMKALYFGEADAGTITLADVDDITSTGLASAIPLHLRYTTQGAPLVGTSLDYFELRKLHPAQGTLPLRIGHAVVGAEAARRLQLAPGDTVLSDQRSLYDLSATYPLQLDICGVLAESGTPDDEAIFIDVKTAWIIDGISHGHRNLASPRTDPSLILERTADEVKGNAAVVEYNTITPENIASFHTHAEHDALPISAAIVVPHSDKSATLLRARYKLSETRRLLDSANVVEEMTRLVFRVQKFFDANFALVATATGILLALIVTLSRQLRRRELETMRRIGCRAGLTMQLQIAELAIVLVASLVVAAGIGAAALTLAPHWTQLL